MSVSIFLNYLHKLFKITEVLFSSFENSVRQKCVCAPNTSRHFSKQVVFICKLVYFSQRMSQFELLYKVCEHLIFL